MQSIFRPAARRETGALGVVGYSELLLSANQLPVQVERTLGRAHLSSGEAQILGRGSEVAMTKQQLNGAHVGAEFQQMNCKCMP